MKVLITGWFSFEQMGATAGDLLARDLVCKWLRESGRGYDVALAPDFEGGVDWRVVDPAQYSHVVFVCGPFGNGTPLTEFLPRFSRSRLVGVNVSLLEAADAWNPFEVLLERDSSQSAHPDITFLSDMPLVPIAGVVLVHRQTEYAGAMHDQAEEAIQRLVGAREAAVVNIDTRLDQNAHGLRSPAEVESLIARMDVVITTRLHGIVLALKNGVPVVAIDPIAGGAKVRRQAEALGWPCIFTADAVGEHELEAAYDYCLEPAGRARAAECAALAVDQVEHIRTRFVSALRNGGGDH